MGFVTKAALAVAATAAIGSQFAPNVLSGLDSNHDYSPLELQAVITAFCLSPLPGMLLEQKSEDAGKESVGGVALDGERDGEVGGNWETAKDGDIENDDYTVASIYAIFYGMYKNAGELTSNHGVKYQFTFNTWGIAPSEGEFVPFDEKDPERHGKNAYRNLVTQPAAMAYKEKLGDTPLQIVEIGCGTAAGANLVTRVVHPTAKYLALDMQQAAINTCNERHATEDNPNLTCQLVPDGVGGRDPKASRSNPGAVNKVPGVADSSVDFVVISETHIADVRIGDMEKGIFTEIRRILKPGGLFLWGNALPTRVWAEADEYLPSVGFELVNNYNWTKGAIVARDEDFDRVEMALDQLIGQYAVMNVPYFGPRCNLVSNRLIANFYRHPGTALYEKMVTGFDSYMHQAWVLDKAE